MGRTFCRDCGDLTDAWEWPKEGPGLQCVPCFNGLTRCCYDAATAARRLCGCGGVRG